MSIYKTRMTNCYPPVILKIYDFQSIIDGEYPEFDLLAEKVASIPNDSYLHTMREQRVEQWEKKLGLPSDSTLPLESRRNIIITRINQNSKLNTETLNMIMETITGGTAEYKIENGVLNIKFTPNPAYFPFNLSNITTELRNRLPAHLGFSLNEYNNINEDSSSDCYAASAITQAEYYNVNVMGYSEHDINVEMVAEPIFIQDEIFYTEVV